MQYLKRLYNYIQRHKYLRYLIVPLVKWYINYKYGKEWRKTNIRCLDNGMVVQIKLENQHKRLTLDQIFKKAFSGFVTIQTKKVYKCPAAIIKVPESYQDYLKLIGSKSRNMLKKVEREGIEFRKFSWNDELDNIYEINTSVEYRQGKKMSDDYLSYPNKIEYVKDEEYSIVHLGAFTNDKLVGYIELYIYGNFAMTNKIIGHKEYLSFGIMNGLVAFAVQYGFGKFEYLNYLSMQNHDTNSLSAFKHRVGFREYAIATVL